MTAIPIEKYLRTGYPEGDREYVDGRLVKRNIRRIDHSDCHTAILVYLAEHYHDYWVLASVRVRVSDTRVRVPDTTCLIGPRPKGDHITEPPFLIVEVLSPEDRA